jgi:PhnB protein
MADTLETYRTITPYLIVADAQAELAFLTAAFGATVTSEERRPDGTIMHAELVVGDSQLMLCQAAAPSRPKEAAFYLWVADCDRAYQDALAAGATSESTPADKPYGHRNAGVIDQNGITWWIGAPINPA